MFRTKLTIVGLVVAAATAPSALAAHDPWYGYAVSLTQAQHSVPFITDTLAPGGTAPAQSYRFITDTLAPGGTASAQSYRFITDTLAPGGGTSVVSVRASSGFDWTDAGIGAGAMAGIGALLLGSVRLLQRRHVVAV
jgi:hypothetical protein